MGYSIWHYCPATADAIITNTFSNFPLLIHLSTNNISVTPD
jgi:hypothetical protein